MSKLCGGCYYFDGEVSHCERFECETREHSIACNAFKPIEDKGRKMSKRSCEYCKYLTDDCRCKAMDIGITSSRWFDEGCPHFEEAKQTIFDKITESVETLADEFVDALYDRVAGEYRYYSMLTAEFYDSRKEALTATVAELKNEYKEQSK
jgi:hypothetical protein